MILAEESMNRFTISVVEDVKLKGRNGNLLLVWVSAEEVTALHTFHTWSLNDRTGDNCTIGLHLTFKSKCELHFFICSYVVSQSL